MKYIKGDICETPLEVIAHGCNMQGVMGAGVAKAIKNRWPEAFEVYVRDLEIIKKYDGPSPLKRMLGYFSDCHTDDGKTIFNVYTQYYYGPGKQARYIDVFHGMLCVARQSGMWDATGKYIKRDVAIPKIGCGLGGLDWSIVEIFLKEIEEKHEIEFWVYEI